MTMGGSLLKSLRKPLLGCAVTALLFGLAEGGLWLLEIPSPGLYTGDLNTVWWLRPGLDTEQRLLDTGKTFSIQTNALGLRGDLPPETGTWTLALGCSTTFGWGVEAGEAWPAVLSAQTQQAVVNAGIPGWSTHQARQGIEDWLAQKPDRIILGYIVRDAQPARLPDAQSRPTPLPMRTHLARLLRTRLTPSTGRTQEPSPPLPTTRVPPAAYQENIAALIEMATPAEVILLAFPQVSPATDWQAVLHGAGPPVVQPTLDPSLFFPEDPIHLTAEGHRELARLLAADPRLGSSPPPRP